MLTKNFLPCTCTFNQGYKESESEVTQSSLTLCNPVDSSLPGSSIHGIFQARILEWVAPPLIWIHTNQVIFLSTEPTKSPLTAIRWKKKGLWKIKQLTQRHKSSSNWLTAINNQIWFVLAEFCIYRDSLEVQFSEFSYYQSENPSRLFYVVV